MNPQTAQYLAWIQSDQKWWEEIKTMVVTQTEEGFYLDDAAELLKQNYNWLEDTPFTQEFLSQVDLQKVCDYLCEYFSGFQSLIEDETELVNSYAKPQVKIFEFKKIDGEVTYGYQKKSAEVLLDARYEPQEAA